MIIYIYFIMTSQLWSQTYIASSDLLIAIAKGYGTLSEIAFALKIKKPVIGIGTWNTNLPLITAKNGQEAVNKAWEMIK